MESWKIILIALAGAAVLGTGIFATVSMTRPTSYSPEVVEAYKQFQIKYNKKESDPDVAAYRLGVFSANYAKINSHKSSSYTLAVNQFADLTAAEFKASYLGLLPTQTKTSEFKHVATGSAPASVDWTTKGDVSAVKNQGQCGSCWAFSTTGSLEACSAIFGKGLGDFSEQQLVDCSQSEGNMGCNGGLMDNAFKYVIANGITTESAYPYTATDGKCKSKITSAFQISKYTDVDASVDALQSAIAQQPVSIGVDAETWQFYSSGIFDNCGTSLDHGVLAAGYTSEYWLVKNSWGADWGEKGYIRLKGNANTCGILNTASYPSI